MSRHTHFLMLRRRYEWRRSLWAIHEQIRRLGKIKTRNARARRHGRSPRHTAIFVLLQTVVLNQLVSKHIAQFGFVLP